VTGVQTCALPISVFEDVRKKAFERMKSINSYHIVHEKTDLKKHLVEMAENSNSRKEISREMFLNNFIDYVLKSLQLHPSAWPFLEAVNTRDVPDYLDVIKHPMDLGLMDKRHHEGRYENWKDFANDFNQMIKNCYTYNGRETQYYKCGEMVEKKFQEIIQRYSDVILSWGCDSILSTSGLDEKKSHVSQNRDV
jgi:histone acetyltransferase